jgi:predicted ester cyclase
MDTATLWQTLLVPWRGGDPDALDDAMTPDVRYHVPPFGELDLNGVKEFAAGFALAFPDFRITLDDTVAEGDRIAYLFSCEATFSGRSPLMPMDPTGRATSASGTVLVRMRGERAEEIWHHGDWLTWLQGAGVIEGLPQAAAT